MIALQLVLITCQDSRIPVGLQLQVLPTHSALSVLYIQALEICAPLDTGGGCQTLQRQA